MVGLPTCALADFMAARHARMVALVEQMLALHQRRAAACTLHEKSVLAAQIAATDGCNSSWGHGGHAEG